MKKLIYVILGLAFMLTQYSCTDESTFNNPATHELENGAFVRFTNNGVAATYPDAADISISEEIYDANGNISEYTLTLQATVAGATYIAEDFIVINSFPATLNITSQSMADAIGLSPSDFGFGDSFNFVATATRNDGVVFYGIKPTFSATTLTVGLGNTEPNLFKSAYNNAMNFGTIVSCPFNQADKLGTYTILDDSGFNAGGGDGMPTQFEIIAGATANQIILVNPFDSAGLDGNGFNIIVVVSDLGIATVARQNAVLTEEVCCAGYTPTSIITNNISLALSCIGLLDLKIASALGLPGSDGTGFGFGSFTRFTAQKN